MKVLVTGGSGWIGQATQRALVARGHEPIPFDRSDGLDIQDVDAVNDHVKEVDHVIHLAGVLGTHELFDSPGEAVDVNVRGSLNVTLACSQIGAGLTEITMPKVNPSLYAATKACAMDIALAYQKAGRLQCSFVRAYNAYGPGQAYGHGHPQKILPTFATKAWAGEPLPIWGYGDLLTDLVHVDDVGRMLVEAMAYGNGITFDAGSGFGQTVRDVALSVLKHVYPDEKYLGERIRYLDERPGERKKSTEDDVAKGEGWELLGGWRPLFDPFLFGQAIDSYKP